MSTHLDLIIHQAKVVTRFGVVDHGVIEVGNGIIQRVYSSPEMDSVSDGLADRTEVVDAEGSWVIPGFVDVHVHGGDGHDFMEASPEAFEAITRYHCLNGTTSLLATTVTGSKSQLEQVLHTADRFMRRPVKYACLRGVHLEGPFINPVRSGAQNPDFIADPNPAWIRDWLERYPDVISMMTLAPEMPNAREVIRILADHRIIAACGHTDADYDVILQAKNAGLSHSVHMFNAMKALHHREPGTVGAILSEPGISTEIIADGLHVHPACIRLLRAAKTNGNLMLITDAISAAGLGNGEFHLGGLDVLVKNGEARLKQGNSLAGSTLNMMKGFRYLVEEIGLTVAEAVELASHNPAARLQLNDTGSIARGSKADLLLVSPELNLQRVWVHGQTPQF